MSAAEIWITIGLMTLATILTRCSFFVFGHALRLPPRVQHALRYAPAAALAAIIAPDLVFNAGQLHLGWTNPKLVAGLGAAAFFIATRRMLATLVVGMTLFTALRLLT